MGFFTGSTIDPVAVPAMFPNTNFAYDTFLSNNFFKHPDGSFGMYPTRPFNPNDAYGQNAQAMQVPTNQNLQNAWQAWQPFDAGTMFAANYLQNGSGFNPDIWAMLANVGQTGGTGGGPTQAVNNMQQWGMAGQKGGPGMDAAMQYGGPSDAVKQFIGNMTQFGVASEGSGRPLANRAYGQPTAASQALQPFIQAAGQPYRAPSIQARQVGRRQGF
jgi:hypothetical protein